MLDDLGDVCLVPGSHLSKDSLVYPNDTAKEPVLPEDTDRVGGTVRRVVRFASLSCQHAGFQDIES